MENTYKMSMIQIFEDITNILYIKYSARPMGKLSKPTVKQKIETLSKLTDKSKLYLSNKWETAM